MTAPAALTRPGTRRAEILAAHHLIKDLYTPVPRFFWQELILTGSAAWAAFLLAAALDGPFALTAALVGLATLLWYRAGVIIHELTHQRRDEIPGFHTAWNLVVGVPWLLPLVVYEGVHSAHHRRTTYGTADDPEYLPFVGRPWAVAGYLASSCLVGPLWLVRFLVAAPVSWLIPPLRRVLIRSGSSFAVNPWYRRTMSRAERRSLFLWECVILLVWWPPLALTLAGVLPWKWLLCWYATYTAVLFVNRLRILAAHRFVSDGSPTDHLGQFADTIDTPGAWWTELWAPLGLRYHALHHLFPTLPFHNLRAAYNRLVAQLPADSFYHEAAGRGLFHSLRELVRRGRRPGAG
jgi:fatty acid desaturase